MDLMTDIFKEAGLRRRILNQQALQDKMTLKFPCDKSIGFHVVTHGEAYLYLEGKEQPLALQKGDIVVLARGRNHFLSTEARLTAKDLKSARILEQLEQLEELDHGRKDNTLRDASKTTIVSGAYQLWNEPLHPFFKELPEIYILKNSQIESFGQIQSALNMLALETTNPQLGSEGLIQNLLDIIFSYILRKIVETSSGKQKTWSFAVRNESIKKAIELLHGQINRDWTLEELAKEVGLSRAGLAQKFKKYLGDTPLHYLMLIRMQKACALLANTSDNLESVAEAVGYKDPFSFSKVFKRVTGMPPRDYRNQDSIDKVSPYRY